MKNYAPIIIFCYRRKIDKLIYSLLRNKESSNSKLFIFSDGFKSKLDEHDVLNVRKSLKKIKNFKSVSIIESDKNNGLANSIIKGATSVINKFGKAIILEDDLILSPHFLNFMNNSLNFYKKNKHIWSISGFSPPIKFPENYKEEVFLSLRPSSWGWATWQSRWNKVNWDIKDFNQFKRDKIKIDKFNMAGNDLFKMLELQYLKKIDSWAIRWCYSQFVHSAFSVTPKISMVQNIGFADKFATHNHNKGNASKWKVHLSKQPIRCCDITINKKIQNDFKKFHDLSFYTNIGYFLKKFGGYEIAKKIKNFKSVSIIESDKNNGLANSIIKGVTSVINKFGKAIILEDDLILSPHFLNFMNNSLNFYKKNKHIWSISGFSPPIKFPKNYKMEVFLSLRSSSWGWATWSNRWNKIDWKVKDFNNLKKNKNKVIQFNQGGNDLFKMLELQYLGKIDSWAIRWNYYQFLHSSYSVTPKISMVQNMGFNDNYSTHTKRSDIKWRVNLAKSKINNFETTINYEIINSFKKFHDLSFYIKIGYFLKKFGGYENAKKLKF